MSTPGSLTSGEDVIIQQQADGSWKEFDGMNAGHLFGPGARPSFIVRKYALNGGTGVDAFREFCEWMSTRSSSSGGQKPEEQLSSSSTSSSANPPSPSPSQRYKLIFYTPTSALERVKTAIFAAGGGTYAGEAYTSCSFESTGTGQFLPIAERGANPTIGKREPGEENYRLERVYEVRCEIMCIGDETTRGAVEALKRTHPYEVPAYEVYRMEDF